VEKKQLIANEKITHWCATAQQFIFLGSWNVRSCFHYYKQQLIMKQMNKYKIKIAGLCETGIYDSGVKTLNDHLLIYSGLPSTTKTRSAHGVAFLLDKDTADLWKKSGSEWEAVNERILKIRLNCTPITMTLLVVYSPVNSTNKPTSDICDQFYFDLQRTVGSVPASDMLLVVGDMNARVGQSNHLSSPQTVGPFTTDICNENGERLFDFCLSNNLVITNSFFQHLKIHQTSWKHPATKEWHTLDYTLVNKSFRSSVEDVRFHRKPTGIIGTDHHLMRIKIKFHLRSRRKTPATKAIILDKSKLKNDVVISAFQNELSTKMKLTNDDNDIDVNVKYEQFVDTLKHTANTHLKSDAKTKHNKPWLTDEIMKLSEAKGAAYLKWVSGRDSSSEKHFRNKYVALRKQLKKLVIQRQIDYWDDLSKDIEEAVKQHDPGTAHAMIRRLKGGKPQIEHMPILDKQGQLLLNASDRLVRFREFFSDLLNVNSVIDQSAIDNIKPTTIPVLEKVRQEKPPTL
jgi:hypothetical protein